MKNEKTDIKKVFSELEALSEWFGRDDIDLDEALKKYQRGVELIKLAKVHLKSTENELKKIARPA